MKIPAFQRIDRPRNTTSQNPGFQVLLFRSVCLPVSRQQGCREHSFRHRRRRQRRMQQDDPGLQSHRSICT